MPGAKITDSDTETNNQKHPESGDDPTETEALQPEPPLRFQPFLVQEKCEELVRDGFKGTGYDHNRCLSVSEKVRANILEVLKPQFDRYRFVVHTVTGGKTGQSVKIRSKALWDEKFDNYFTIAFEEQDLFVFVTVFGIYFD